jgi:nitroreductase
MKKEIILLGVMAGAMSACMGEKNDSVETALAERHSGYSYDAQKVITSEQLQKIIQAGRNAPSSYNDQPWAFVICDRVTNPLAYEKVLKSLVEFNQKWAQAAPVLVVIAAQTNSRENKFNRHAQYDTGAAAGYMALQAASLGLMAHQMGGFDAEKISIACNLPKDVVPMSVMAIGYESEEHKKKSIKKERKPTEQSFFDGSWGKTNTRWSH